MVFALAFWPYYFRILFCKLPSDRLGPTESKKLVSAAWHASLILY